MEKNSVEIIKKFIEISKKIEDKYYYSILQEIYNKEIKKEKFNKND